MDDDMGVAPGFAGGISKDALQCVGAGGLGETVPSLESTSWLDSPNLLHL